MLRLLREKLDDPAALRKFHGWATIVWICLVPVSLIFLANSIPWLVFMSVWANVAGHWSAWQAGRAEVKEQEHFDDDPS